jgi:hypothetical protein
LEALMRFLPDTLRDAFWRPISMAAPNAGVYVEIMAPDLRFVCLVVLTLLALVFALRRSSAQPATWVLLAFAWLSFVPWLMTTGNGRYFIPILLIAGPLCLALIHQLPFSATFRLLLAGLVVGLQGYALVQNTPWRNWVLAAWGQPYYPIALTNEEREQPATYVTFANISYSLIAPQFDHRSHWVGLASLSGDPERADDRRAQTFLRQAAGLLQPIKLVIPTIPDHIDDAQQPDADVRGELNRLLGLHRLALQGGNSCKLVLSRGLASQALPHPELARPATIAKFGFWICPLTYPVARPAPAAPSPESRLADQVFVKVEHACPRLFPPGETISERIPEGFVRNYPSADIKAYVLPDSNEVLYKYWRALNPGKIGTLAEVLAESFTMNCNAIKGRSGLPWERQL